MHCDLRRLRRVATVAGLRIERGTDHARFAHEEHPYIGRMTTSLRRKALATQRLLNERSPERGVSLFAGLHDKITGAAMLFLDGQCSGLWDVGVLEASRNRGIGTALTAHACGMVRDAGYSDCVLIASGMGFNVYRHVGFEEVCKLGYFYSRLGRNEAQ